MLRRGDIVRLFVAALALVLVVWALPRLAGVLLTFTAILVVAMVFSGPVSWLERRGIPRTAGTALVAIITLVALLTVGRLVLLPLVAQAVGYLADLPQQWARAQAWLAGLALRFPFLQGASDLLDRIIAEVSAAARAGIVSGDLPRQILAQISVFAIAAVTTLFTVAVPRPLLVGLLALAPEAHRPKVARALRASAVQMRVWVGASAFVGLVDSVVIFFGLSFLGVQPAAALALLTFIGEFIPYVGPIVAAIPAIFIALLISPLTALWVLLLYVVVQQLESNILHPIVVARGMHFHPLSVTFAILALGTLFGIPGAFLAIPVLAVIKAFYEAFRGKPDGAALRHLANEVLGNEGEEG